LALDSVANEGEFAGLNLQVSSLACTVLQMKHNTPYEVPGQMF